MKPTETLPSGYALAWQLNLKQNLRLNLFLQLAGALWFGLAFLFFWKAFSWLRPPGEEIRLMGDALAFVVGLLLVVMAVVVLHELAHGAAFWWFAGQRPHFGIGPSYAYAAMPGWYFPKRQYLAIGLAPLVSLTLLGLALVPFLPNAWLAPFLWGLSLNAGGAIGDLYICFRIAREAEDILVRDLGDGFEVYRRQ